MSLKNDPSHYDAYYFAHCCGEPYERVPIWLQLFNGIADSIVRRIQPRTALDVGCAMGFLVEGLRDRAVDAYGIDISEYAVQRVRPDLQPYCHVGSILDPQPRRYDLIVCIEVLEHLPSHLCENGVRNLCAASDDVLFSSTPFDYHEPSHLNVQRPEYWAELFAINGFVCDIDFDASFITPWAKRFRKSQEPLHRIVRQYERHIWTLSQENRELRQVTLKMRDQLAYKESSNSDSSQSLQIPLTAKEHKPQPSNILPQVFQKAGETMPRPIEPRYVLLISQDTVGTRMAGPGIRYYHLARTLSRKCNVVLAVPDEVTADLPPQEFRIVQYRRRDWSSLWHLAETAQIIILPSDIASDFPELTHCPAFFVIDGYDPLLAEWLATAELFPEEKNMLWVTRMHQLGQQYLLGDFFICASERQRDWWLGLLEANGRINPWTYAEDPSLRRLVDVVPYGLPTEIPQHTRSIIREMWPGIHAKDRIVLWGGGLWPWLDPITAVQAIARVRSQRQDVCLIFPGTLRPNPSMAAIPHQTEATRTQASQLGLLDVAVFFGDWVPYGDWQNVLLESDLGVTLHGEPTLEARLAFRSRVLDYIWAGLPIIATHGDVTGDLVAQHRLGTLVGSGDVDGVAQAILQLLDAPRDSFAERFEHARQSLTWERASQSLLEYCQHPRRAPDKQNLGMNLGNPYYIAEIERWKSLVHKFERRRVVRLLNWGKSFVTQLHRDESKSRLANGLK